MEQRSRDGGLRGAGAFLRDGFRLGAEQRRAEPWGETTAPAGPVAEASPARPDPASTAAPRARPIRPVALPGRDWSPALPWTALPWEAEVQRRVVPDLRMLRDGSGARYAFEVHAIAACPNRTNAVYAFASHTRVLWLGAAAHLRTSLSDRRIRLQARRDGALFLLVHCPGPTGFLPYTQIADRLNARLAADLHRA
jgi:hypothetical protein